MLYGWPARNRAVGGLVAGLVAAGAFLAITASSASAGRLVATGHDLDDHCGTGDPVVGAQCHFMQLATDYVRAGAPDPSLPVLLLDCTGNTEAALDNAFGPGAVPRARVCPSADPETFTALPLSTGTYSAIILGSSCEPFNSLNQTADQPGGCDEPGGSTPDSDLINGRAVEIHKYFSAGGGIFVMSGHENGDGNPATGPDVFYDFALLGVQSAAIQPPFCLTPLGIELGFEDRGCPDSALHNGTRDDINCCPTHNSFAEPGAGSLLKATERDSNDRPVTLVVQATIRGEEFVPVAACGANLESVTISGTVKDEVIVGTAGRDVIAGGPGDDKIAGRGGNDVICGHAGDDKLRGNGGTDRLRGSSGKDKLSGSGGKDRLSGGRGNDRLNGGRSRDKLNGGGGRDKIAAVDDLADSVNCKSGRDQVTVDEVDRVKDNCEIVRRRD